MACCAFALFLVTQLFAPFRALAKLLGFSGSWVPDPAVEWRPGIVMERPVGASRFKRGLGAFVAIDLAMLAVLGTVGASTSSIQAEQARGAEAIMHAYICGSERKTG